MYRCSSEECFKKFHTVYNQSWVEGSFPTTHCHCGLEFVKTDFEKPSSRSKHIIKGDTTGTSQNHYSGN